MKSSDRHVLAAAAADSLVIASDPDAEISNRTYWKRGRPWIDAVVASVAQAPDETIRTLGASLQADPQDAGRYFELRTALAERAEPISTEAIFEAAWEAACHSRLGFHVGPRYERTSAPVGVHDVSAHPPGPRGSVDGPIDVLVIVPFQGREAREARLRNLVSCLLALRDQSFPRERYAVALVESDEVPRVRSVAAPFVDHYAFAFKEGIFNKSWAANVGAVHSPGNAPLLCFLDADMLVDRDYIARNAARFQRPGTGAHVTYRDVLCLDPASSSAAIRQRIHRRAPAADTSSLRGFLGRRPRGGSFWIRRPIFERIGGFDERYQGWGGEDVDFFFRVELATPLDSYDDTLLHLHHPPGPIPRHDGKKVNARIPWLSWQPEEPIGRLDRFAKSDAP
ncbi:hypothetical protein LVJ94_24935 [Pendulispora rubella]|uniref:Galactosyltransferase C-terminal domain-containing protein n=1 Tax=Pendulispora rubella TaxID=2741070 RepID=A0ABZ2LHQ5_9BACT